MKHLLSIMAVFLLMGCQTTDTTPKDTISPEKAVKEEKPQIPPMELANPVIVHKPLLCADGQTLVTGIVKNHGEQPIGWFTSEKQGMQGQDHKILIMANLDKGTISILEYPNPSTACFLAVGEDLELTKELKSKKTKGNPVSYKRVLTLK